MKRSLYIGIALISTFLSCKQTEVVSTQKAPIENNTTNIKTDARPVEHQGKPIQIETESKKNTPVTPTSTE